MVSLSPPLLCIRSCYSLFHPPPPLRPFPPPLLNPSIAVPPPTTDPHSLLLLRFIGSAAGAGAGPSCPVAVGEEAAGAGSAPAAVAAACAAAWAGAGAAQSCPACRAAAAAVGAAEACLGRSLVAVAAGAAGLFDRWNEVGVGVGVSQPGHDCGGTICKTRGVSYLHTSQGGAAAEEGAGACPARSQAAEAAAGVLWGRKGVSEKVVSGSCR